MLGAVIFWVLRLLLPGLLLRGKRPSCGDKSIAAVRHAFKEHNISALIHLPFHPVVLFELSFPEPDASTIQISAGEQLTPNETTLAPEYCLCGDSRKAAGHGPFVIAGIDPDAPTALAPTLAQVRHFLGGGFYLEPEHHGKQILVSRTPAVSDYIAPAPPAGSGPHRYIFLLFRESPEFKHQKLVNSSSSLLNFNLSAFVEATRLGTPLGGSFFLVVRT